MYKADSKTWEKKITIVQKAGIKFKNKIRKQAEIYCKDAKLRSILWNKNLYLRNVLLTLIKLKSTSKTEVSLNKFKCLENRRLNKKKNEYIFSSLQRAHGSLIKVLVNPLGKLNFVMQYDAETGVMKALGVGR